MGKSAKTVDVDDLIGGPPTVVAKLTSKQERFAQLIASGKSQADAYRGAFDASNSTAKSCQEIASRMMTDIKIQSRIEILRQELISKIAQDVVYEYEDAIVELDDAIAFAKKCGVPGAVVAALNLKQKISGLHVEDRKNDRNPVAGMTSERVKAALEALQVVRKLKELA